MSKSKRPTKKTPSKKPAPRKGAEKRRPDPTPVSAVLSAAPTTPALTSGTCKRCGETVKVQSNGQIEAHKNPTKGITCGASLEQAGKYLVEGDNRSDPTSITVITQPTKMLPASPRTALATELAALKPSEDNAPHIEVQALAGAGKTTTVIEGCKEAKGVRSALTPSDQQREVWKALAAGNTGTIRISSFASKITNELKTRVEECGLDKQGVQAQGIHSLGLSAVTKHFGRVSAQQAKWVVADIVLGLLGKPGGRIKDLPRADADALWAVDTLVSLCKQTLTEPIPDNLDWLASRYDVDLNSSRQKVYELVPQALEKCLEPQGGRITFDDMIWLALKHDLPIHKVDLQVVDESQDLNRMQQELIYRAGHRILFVGDKHQAIYGFSGADSESMEHMHKKLGGCTCPRPTEDLDLHRRLKSALSSVATCGHCKQEMLGRGCITLPLTMTRRCGRAIVAEAKRYVPEYEAHPSNPEGLVTSADYEEGKPKQYRALAAAGDFVLCRTNAPLVSQCFRFIKAGKKANILGKNIGQGLLTLIDKSKAHSAPDLISWLGDWLAKETANENAKRYPSEGRLDGLQDRHDCILAFCEGQSEVEGVIARINSVFTDDKDDKGVTLSSIHRSKGLEASRVFILQPKNSGPRMDKMQEWELEQNENLQYVAITRAINELVWVS